MTPEDRETTRDTALQLDELKSSSGRIQQVCWLAIAASSSSDTGYLPCSITSEYPSTRCFCLAGLQGLMYQQHAVSSSHVGCCTWMGSNVSRGSARTTGMTLLPPGVLLLYQFSPETQEKESRQNLGLHLKLDFITSATFC